MNHESNLFNDDQMADAVGSVEDQVTSSLGSDREAYFNTGSQDLPRPNYDAALYRSFGDYGIAYGKGVQMEMSDTADRLTLGGAEWQNMRVAVARVTRDNRLAWYPGTIGPNGTAIYLESHLMADPNAKGDFTEIESLALDNAYLTEASSAKHGQGATNAAESKHGLVLASRANALDIHSTVHDLDGRGNFTNNNAGVQDIATANGTRQVRPRVIDLSMAHTIAIRPEFQPESEERLFGLDVSPQQLLVAGTLAAARSRQVKVNISENITRMIEAR